MKIMFAGSFNPPTLGHVDLVRTASAMFDGVVVCIMANAEKKYALSPEVRLELLNKCFKGFDNVEAVIGSGLTAEFAAKCGCGALLRGVRNTLDFDYEMQMADVNSRVFGMETIFLPAKPELSFISSSIVTDIARCGGDISKMVPAGIIDDVTALLKK